MMVFNHVFGILVHPKEEWREIRGEGNHSIAYSYLSHVLFLAAFPVIAAYVGATHVGWHFGSSGIVRLTASSGLTMAIFTYIALLFAVLAMGYMVKWMAHTYDAKPTLGDSVLLAAYAATPLFLAGIMSLYPSISLNVIVGCIGISYAIYQLYVGLPIMMDISEERGFLFSSAVLGVALVGFVALLALTAVLWGMGFGPVYTS